MAGEPAIDDPRDALLALVAGLRVELERMATTGARGLPAASEALIRERRALAVEESPGAREEPAGAAPSATTGVARRPADRGTPATTPGGSPHEVIALGGDPGVVPMAARRVVAPSPGAGPGSMGGVPLAASAAAVVAASGGDPSAPGVPARPAAAGHGRPGPALSPLVVPVSLTATPGEPGDRLRALGLLQARVRDCRACGLAATRTQTVFARGTGSSGLCFVGEGPGADEDAQGQPFVGAAGQLLDKMIAGMGLARDDVYVCNIVKCRPPENRTPTPEEMEACRGHLTEQLALLQPQVIVALGATAAKGLLGTTEGITRLRGRWKLYQGIAVMPTFHPAYVLRNAEARRPVWEDLKAVLRQLGRPVPGEAR